jgi:hypothetical protein
MKIGDNLTWLLGFQVNIRVLIIGDGLTPWRDAFQNCSFLNTPDYKIGVRKPYGLIFYHSACAKSYDEFLDHLSLLRTLIGNGGALLIAAENSYSLSNLKKRWMNRAKGSSDKLRIGISSFRRAIVHAKLTGKQIFVPMPSLSDLSEMVIVGSQLLEVPHYWHPILHLANRLGRYHWFADSFLFFSLQKRIEDGSALRYVAEKLTPPGHSIPRLILERIDLRVRGAMVLFIRMAEREQYLIIRVVSDPATQVIVIRNHNILTDLRKHPGLSDEMKSLIPIPISAFEIGNSFIYIESMLQGIPAWKTNRPQLRKQIYKESVKFILNLNQASRIHTKLSNDSIDQLLSEDLKRLDDCAVLASELMGKIDSMILRIRHLLNDRNICLVFGHGDYGYGNILVEPNTGKLTGIIDWDTGRQRDLAGIDLINLEIQRERSENHKNIYSAFVSVVQAVLSRDGLDTAGIYRREFEIKSDLLPALLAFALLRCITRSAQYPNVFITEQNDYFRAIDFMNEKVFP